MYGQEDLLLQTKKYPFQKVLDIGMGKGEASLFFLKEGKTVFATGSALDFYKPNNDLLKQVKFYQDVDIQNMKEFDPNSFDAIWVAHVLEHVQNIGLALNEINRILKPGGYLFIMVPPYKPNIAMGHVSTGWNLWTLMYNLLITGFNVKNGSFIYHGYNIAGFVQKTIIKLPPLNFNADDYFLLKDFFPIQFKLQDVIKTRTINWEWYNKNTRIKYAWKKKTISQYVPFGVRRIIKKILLKSEN